MDNSLSVIDINRMLAELKASCSEHYELSELNCLEENLQSLMQRRQDHKAEFLRVIEEQLVLCQFQKQPEDWLTLRVAETQLSESKETLAQVMILSNKTEKIQEIVDVAADALLILKEKLSVLESRIIKLEEKHTELSGSSVTNNVTMQSAIKCSAMKISELLTSAQVERDIVRRRVQRMEDRLNSFENLSALQSRKEAAARDELTRMEDKLKELEKLSGMSCRVKDRTSLEIDFMSAESLPVNPGEDHSIPATPEDVRLTITLTFRENEQKYLELENVQTNQMVQETQSLIRDAKLDKDLPKLITELKKMWQTHVPLITEISQIKSRHAIDWIQEKGLLYLIPKRSSSVVCALKVPSTYPFSGPIILESITGHVSQVDHNDILPPSNNSLMGWVRHLEDLFGLP